MFIKEKDIKMCSNQRELLKQHMRFLRTIITPATKMSLMKREGVDNDK